MDKKEFDALVGSLKQVGLNEKQILGVFIEAFEQKKCDIDDLEAMFNWMGYHLTPDFYKDHGIKKKTSRITKTENK